MLNRIMILFLLIKINFIIIPFFKISVIPGNKYPQVLPEPVFAIAKTSFPLNVAGHDAD